MEDYSNMSAYIERILSPISRNLTEFDLSTDEKFFQIKSEINKLDNIDACKVKADCIELLCGKVKDLRLFVYLIFSCLFEPDSLDEWNQALRTLVSFFARYKSEMYPEKPSARMVALSWLNQDRVKLIFMKRIEKISHEKLIAYQESVSDLNRVLSENIECFGGEVAVLFERWLKSKVGEIALISKEISITEKEKIDNPKTEKIISYSDSFENIIKNSNEIESATIAIIDYCELHGRWIQAASYRRSLRWAALVPRVDDRGVTALSNFPEKNQLLLLECEKNYINSPKECYKKCEELFLLPGGQVKLDIQYYAIKSAQIFNMELANFIKEALFGFVKRFPGVEKWQYNTKENCTSFRVIKWIQEEIVTSNSSMIRVDNQKNGKINDNYEIVLRERELLLLKSLCGI